MQRIITEQEKFWQGEFGDDYTERNESDDRNNCAFWREIFQYKIDSALELGANVGSNLKCLKKLFPKCELSAVEINEQAVKKLKQIDGLIIYPQSILSFEPKDKYDLVFTKGVLIHIAPERLREVYKLMHDASSKYVVIAEYYSPVPVGINYRGHSGKLFKRDFAGEFLDMFPDFGLLDYGFWYHRDKYPQDDINYFVMRKK